MDEKQLQALANELVKNLTPPQDLNQFERLLKKISVEAALNTEMTHHLGRRAQPVSEPADTGRTVPGGVDYISGQDQKWWPAAAGIAAYGSNHAGFTVWLKVIFLLNIVR